MVHSIVRPAIPGCDIYRPYYAFLHGLIEADLLTEHGLSAALSLCPVDSAARTLMQSVSVESVSGVTRLEIQDVEGPSESFFRFSWIEDDTCLFSVTSPTTTSRPWIIHASGIGRSHVLRTFCLSRWPGLSSSIPFLDIPKDERGDWFSPFVGSFLEGLIEVFAECEPTQTAVRSRTRIAS